MSFFKSEMDRESAKELVRTVDDGTLIHLLYVILAEFQERFYVYRAASQAAGTREPQEPQEPRGGHDSGAPLF